MHLVPSLLLAVVGLAPPASAQSSDPFASVRAAMQRMVDAVGSPSVAVAIAKDGRILWEDAIGWANREKRIPATANTMYALASISKPITATGLMVLVDRGQVDLDRPANAYLGAARLTGLAGNADGATSIFHASSPSSSPNATATAAAQFRSSRSITSARRRSIPARTTWSASRCST